MDSGAKSLLDAAQEAADAGDYEAAERLLREAAALQEATFGPLHPDLANIFNNLGVVCERTEKLAEAERGYRRAHAIAVASFAPGHPFVATSLKNLVDFCVARGIAVWTPPQVQQAAGTSSLSPAAPPTAAVPVEPEGLGEPASIAREINPRVIGIVALSVSALVAILFVTPWRGSGDSEDPSPEAQPAPLPNHGSALSSSTTPADASAREPQPAAPPRETSRQPPARVERDQRPGLATTSPAVTVLSAQVCSEFETQGSPDWQCTPVSGVSQPGTLIFYTRLLTGSDTTVEHRWYRGDRLHQAVNLAVRASQSSGYRTYSRNTVIPERAGDWKVELRASDGTVLREEHFVIR